MREARRRLEENLVSNKRGALWVSRVVEDGSNTTTGFEETDNSLDDPERREDSEDESGDMNEAWRTGVRKRVSQRLFTYRSNADGPRYPTRPK